YLSEGLAAKADDLRDHPGVARALGGTYDRRADRALVLLVSYLLRQRSCRRGGLVPDLPPHAGLQGRPTPAAGCHRAGALPFGRGFAVLAAGDFRRAPLGSDIGSGAAGAVTGFARSEERRVGKECRSRGA